MTDVKVHLSDALRADNCKLNGAPPLSVGECSNDGEADGAASDPDSVQEISDLVSAALEHAMLAAAKPCPTTYLAELERRKIDRLIERMNGLPSVQLYHPDVQAEIYKEFAMMRAQSKLANGIVEGIRDYARSKQRAVMWAVH